MVPGISMLSGVGDVYARKNRSVPVAISRSGKTKTTAIIDGQGFISVNFTRKYPRCLLISDPHESASNQEGHRSSAYTPNPTLWRFYSMGIRAPLSVRG
jgi:hypothetical protein